EFQRLESEFFADLENARASIDAEGRLQLVNQIEQATREFVGIFKEELVPAKQQVLRLVAEELDEYGPEASQALRRAIDGITNRDPDSPLRVSLEQLIHDTLLMRMATQRYFADGTEKSEKALSYAMEDVTDALTFLDMDTVPDFIRQYMDSAIKSLQSYQASVKKLLAHQTAMNRIKTEKLDVLGPEITLLARDLEQEVFEALEVVADEAEAETDSALRLTLAAFVTSVVLGLVVALLMSRTMAKTVKRARSEILQYLEDIGNSQANVETRLTTGRPDEIGDFISAVNAFLETLQETITGIARASGKLSTESDSLSDITERTTINSEQQRDQITQVSAAMQEMVATSDEIASNTSDTDESAREAARLADTGQITVSEAVRSVSRLAEQIQEGSQRVQRLEQESGEIGSVLEVIQSIAEQTNLLALNAAIEA
ncbi:MAG: methyl-accepting chemotaxis protein, partial [Marinobacter sp.]|nr:methyl-accepting chemotaxis protein [Marinobacter sp.]